MNRNLQDLKELNIILDRLLKNTNYGYSWEELADSQLHLIKSKKLMELENARR